MFADRLVIVLVALAAALVVLAVAGVTPFVTSLAGLIGLGVAFGAEQQAAKETGVPLGQLPRPKPIAYLAIATPFLVAVSAAGEEHVLAAVGAAVLSQAAFVRLWRTRQPRGA